MSEFRNSFVFRGESAELRWGYQPAAVLKNWTLDASSHTVTAQVVSSDAYRVSQQPMAFVIPRQGQPWTWEVKELQITGQTLTASLVPEG